MIELQRCSDKEQWDDYILENGGHPLQLWGWGQVKAGHGWSAERFFAVKDHDKIIGAVQVLIKKLPAPFRSVAYVPRGPLVDPEYISLVLNTLSDIVKRTHHSVSLSIEPDEVDFEIPEGWVRSPNKILSAETILLDLRKTEEELLNGMAKKTRQYIRKSATDITIKQAKNRDDIDVCLNLYEKTSQRAGFSTHDRQYYFDVFMQLQDHSPIYIAYDGKEAVAFLWLAISEKTAYELYGGMNEIGQELRANYALKWYVIRKAKEWGLERYDFGGLVAGGVSTFKQGWSADATLLAGSFDKSLSPFYPLWAKGLPVAKKTIQSIRKRK